MQTVWLQKTTYKWIGLVAGIILLLLCVAASILFGVHATAWRQVWEAFTSYNGSTEHLIVREVRVPRALIAAFVGGSLGICGVLLQSLTKNPLADSGIFGINAGASLFVVASFVLFGVSSLTSFTWIAFMGAGVSCLFVFVLGSAGRQGLTPLKITLAGAAITAFCSSMTNGMLIISGRAMEEVLFWMSGSVEGRSLDILLRLLPYMLAAWVVSILISSSVNTLMLGDDVAKSLGQKTALLKLTMGVLIVVLAGSSVAVAGPIGFLGLVIPHIARTVVGKDIRWLIPYSAAMGGILLLLADIAARFIAMPREIPIGVMTAIIGVPFFIHAARKGLLKK
ncbi:FecCD family ABC transporter permease [Paenibacillus cookii]|uniref:Siderophore ABC transporter permease n=1 Tax=Paenibacillus cookii TaxID=157839 RepID=A0ABQ4LQ31_9BACL|nr:putative siderophore transport system permease protein YfiZ precursor [Paenibacillus sp. P1XP2]GIO65374.1 siderophore ABC transporter permease [Paenibacillus cookii]